MNENDLLLVVIAVVINNVVVAHQFEPSVHILQERQSTAEKRLRQVGIQNGLNGRSVGWNPRLKVNGWIANGIFFPSVGELLNG